MDKIIYYKQYWAIVDIFEKLFIKNLYQLELHVFYFPSYPLSWNSECAKARNQCPLAFSTASQQKNHHSILTSLVQWMLPCSNNPLNCLDWYVLIHNCGGRKQVQRLLLSSRQRFPTLRLLHSALVLSIWIEPACHDHNQ